MYSVQKNYSLRSVVHIIGMYLYFILPLSLQGQYTSHGLDILNLVQGPGAEVYGGVSGLLESGSENTIHNPMALTHPGQKDFYLYHSIWFNGSLSASSVAYSYNTVSDRPIGIMVSKIGVDNIADSRNALLDYGADGLPGTFDEGENNGELDPGERLNYDNIQYTGISNYIFTFATPLKYFKGKTGLGINVIYQDLISTKGLGLAFDLYLEADYGPVGALYKFSNLPSAASFFDNGKTEFYAPKIEGNWIFPVYINKFGIIPGVSAVYYPGESRVDLFDLSNMGSLEFLPSLRLEIDKKVHLGFSYQPSGQLYFAGGLQLNYLDIHYAIRGINGDLGQSHLIAVKFSLESLFTDD